MDDPYSILGLYSDCTYEQAKAAYRKAALMHHPDRHPPARKAEAERRFRILAHAFQQISNELGHPVTSKPNSSNSPASSNTKKTPSCNSGLVQSSPSASPAAPSSVSQQLSKSQKSGDRLSEPTKKLENHHYPSRSTKSSPLKAIHSDEPHRISPPQDLLDDLPEFSKPSRPNSSSLEDDEQDDFPSVHPLPRASHPTDRRSSFSHPSERGSKSRAMVNDYDHSMGPKRDQYYRYPDREQLYSLPPRNRDRDWDFGLGGDDFFSSGMDRFGSTGVMMDGLSLGFDRMMSSAFQGLSMAGPDPNELARMQDGSNCSMRMRQSKMVMGRGEDGSWAGKKMEKHMNMANGRLEVSENAQDVKMGGAPPGPTSRYPPPRNGNMRRGPQDWDPPPAYHGGESHLYGEEEQEPYVGLGELHRMGPGMAPPHGDIPGHARHASLSRSSKSNLANMGSYYDQPSGLERRASSRFDYGPDPGHSNGSMGRHDMLLGQPHMARSLSRRTSGEVSARY